MNDALITRVTGEENGQMRLEEIERQGLFLQRMDDTRRVVLLSPAVW